MKLRFPLVAKILLWFFLNLVLLGGGFYAVFRFQFRIGLNSLLAGQAGERVGAVGNVIGTELHEAPREQWTDILHRFNTAYGIRFYVFRADGNQVAGDGVVLPGEVRERLMGFARIPGPFPPQRMIRPGPPNPDDEPHPPRPDPAPVMRQPPPRFLIRTINPVGYWVGMRLPAVEREFGGGPPHFLLAQSTTLSAGGLFFDFKPWVLTGFGAVILSVLFWLPLIRGITRSISQVTSATEQVANGRFDIRVNDTRRDELGRLGGAINTMAGRLNGFVTGQKRFLGDVAHELCSPLARIQIALGILEQRADDNQRPAVDDLREEVEHMSALVNELLSFTKAGMREKEIKLQPVRLAELARQVVAREAAGQVQLEVAEELQAQAEPDLLTRALANLVRNAVRYAGSAGPITVSARAEADHVSLIVTDCGPGVPADALQQIFDPFYRLESSRSADTGGIGLGLTIVKTCVEACRGTVTATNRSPTGLQVEIKLAGVTNE